MTFVEDQGLTLNLKKGDGGTNKVTSSNYTTDGIEKAIGGSPGNRPIQNAIAQLVQQVLGYTVKETGNDQKNKDITAKHVSSAGTGDNKVKVIIKDSTQPAKSVEGVTSKTVLNANNKVTITITVEGDPSGKTAEATKMSVIVILVYFKQSERVLEV